MQPRSMVHVTMTALVCCIRGALAEGCISVSEHKPLLAEQQNVDSE